jgi:hypothetical protein
MRNDKKLDEIRLYVCNALHIFLRGHDPDLLQKSKELNEMARLKADPSWGEFVGAIHGENNSWVARPNSSEEEYCKRMEDERHSILIRTFRKYGLID